ncbi:MAG TPA: DEDD exonuclease domain-containing protein, partial [Acidimicrobiales bacterium]
MQRSFDDLGTPLAQVTFCVLDLETTGASPADCKITEVGAIKVRGGECLGTFETLVNPQTEIPFFITVLTGITTAMVVPAPTIGEILPNFLEFLGDAVIVGHNVRFDVSFLQAALANEGYPRMGNRWVDTCALARRLVRDEVPDCRLSTLADRMRLPHQPCHRAMADTLATTDLLHALLERAGTIGVLGLDDLIELPTIRAHPQVGKLKLTAKLPRAPGVYMFRGLGGRVLYVGKATNLRARVRSYFGGDERRKISQLLRETVSIDHVVCSGPLEAAVLEVRLIHRHLPPFNHRSKLWSRYAYLKLTLNEPFPRLSVVRTVRAGDGCLYLGPLSSTGAARLVAEAIESAVPLRRCTARPSQAGARAGLCTAAQLGVATCPCAGAISQSEYAAVVDRVVRGLTVDPSTLFEPLEQRMADLARAERFEEAADVRDRAAALARALTRHRRLDSLRRAGRVELDVDGSRVVLAGGRLSATGDNLALFDPDDPAAPPDAPLPRHLVDEVA